MYNLEELHKLDGIGGGLREDIWAAANKTHKTFGKLFHSNRHAVKFPVLGLKTYSCFPINGYKLV